MTKINIEKSITELRKQKIILDYDVAKIYGVETRDINKAVKNNLSKFPKNYIFKLSKKEFDVLRCNFSTANLVKTRVLPKAFTEKGLYMLATILKSKKATRATFQIIETFSKIKEFSRVAKNLAASKSSKQQKDLIKQSGELIGDILNNEFANDKTSETTIELNLAMIKIKHTIKNKKSKITKII